MVLDLSGRFLPVKEADGLCLAGACSLWMGGRLAAAAGKKAVSLLAALLLPLMILLFYEEWARGPEVVIPLGVPSSGLGDKACPVPSEEGSRGFSIMSAPAGSSPNLRHLALSGSPAPFLGPSTPSTLWPLSLLEGRQAGVQRVHLHLGGSQHRLARPGRTPALVGPWSRVRMVQWLWLGCSGPQEKQSSWHNSGLLNVSFGDDWSGPLVGGEM